MIKYVCITIFPQYSLPLNYIHCLKLTTVLDKMPKKLSSHLIVAPLGNLRGARAIVYLGNVFSKRIIKCQTPLLFFCFVLFFLRIDVFMSSRHVCFLKWGVLIILRSYAYVLLTLGKAITNVLPHPTLVKYYFLKPVAEYYTYSPNQVKWCMFSFLEIPIFGPSLFLHTIYFICWNKMED